MVENTEHEPVGAIARYMLVYSMYKMKYVRMDVYEYERKNMYDYHDVSEKWYIRLNTNYGR